MTILDPTPSSRRIPYVPGRLGRKLLFGTSIAACTAIFAAPVLAPWAAAAVAGAALLAFAPLRPKFAVEREPGEILLGEAVFEWDRPNRTTTERRRMFPREFMLDRRMLAKGVVGYGTSGAGKSELMVGLARKSMEVGGGVLYIDGKGDVAMYAKIFEQASACGREDDVLVLNLMTGNMGLSSQELSITNTFNPLDDMDDAEIVSMLLDVASLHQEKDGPGGVVQYEKGVRLIQAVLPILRWMETTCPDTFTIEGVLSAIRIEWLVGIALDLDSSDGEFAGISRLPSSAVPEHMKEQVRAYLDSLPGYIPEKGPKQSNMTMSFHEIIRDALWRSLDPISRSYAHVFTRTRSEIRMSDIVRGRRILMVMLPSMEKKREDVDNLIKLVVAPLKAAVDRDAGAGRGVDAGKPFLIMDDEAVYDRGPIIDFTRRHEGSGVGFVSMRQEWHAQYRSMKEPRMEVAGPTGIGAMIVMRAEDPAIADLVPGVDPSRIRRQEAGECTVVVERGVFSVKADYPRMSLSFRNYLRLGKTQLVPVPEAVR
jgi:hypothetical protein